MKKIIYIVTDKDGNTKDESGNPFGYYKHNEIELCKRYCKQNELKYREKVIHIW